MQQMFDVVPPLNEYPMYDAVISTISTEQLPLSALVDDDYFKNDAGYFRWSKIREAYHKGLIDVDKVRDLYLKWRDDPEYYTADGFDVWGEYGNVSPYGKCAKRGNDVYKHRIKEKFSKFDSLPPINFTEIFDGHTPMIFVTLTVDAKKYSLDEAWEAFPQKFHEFESSLRQDKLFGDFVRLRVWEAHESGYPHCHVVYYFKHKMYLTFRHRNKKGNVVHLIQRKYKDKISGFWSMTDNPVGVDVQAVTDTSGAFSEVKKYVTKTVFTKKGDLTNAMLCLFRKQQYSVSKDFIEVVWGSIAGNVSSSSLNDVSRSVLVKREMHNCNKRFPNIVDFRFSGVISQSNVDALKKKEPPPPTFRDQDYNVFRLNGMVDESSSDAEKRRESWSGSFDLSDEEVRFILGLPSLEMVAASKPSLLSCWFGWMDRYVVHEPDIVYCSKCEQLVGYHSDVGNGGYCPECLELSMFVKKDKL